MSLDHQERTKSEAVLAHPLLYEATTSDVLVDFNGQDDPYRSINWPFRKKAITTILYGLTTCWITFASAIYSAGMLPIAHEFGVSKEVSTLGISLLVFGLGLGPLLWAPLSEIYGRKTVTILPYFIAGIFSFGTATAKDIQTLMITRFFSGFFGSSSVAITGGAMADIWRPEHRGVAIVVYSVTLVGGPCLGPIIGGAFVSNSSLGWRWTEYLTGILMVVQSVLDFLILDESYAPALLVRKARRLRLEGKNWALHAKHEEWDVSISEMSQKYLIRPFQILNTPIGLFMSIYGSFVYGCFPIEFQEKRGWGHVTGGLPFVALLVGIFAAALANVYNNRYYFRKLRENDGKPVPEARLPPMMVGGVAFTGDLFIFACQSLTPRYDLLCHTD
ncbi:MSF drug transporter [Aspergillus luchuensis]|uniref:MSF drug transporter n=1 Tax=Aspergillus kawachii TaxID=1069201 RepID=A0A146G0M2_ASPKA|nr:MSF drug transporter [Aspergillus luchuensis]